MNNHNIDMTELEIKRNLITKRYIPKQTLFISNSDDFQCQMSTALEVW